MAPSVPPATSFMTKRLMPKGGVMEAMLSRTVMMTPNQIRSQPKTFAMGTKIGTQSPGILSYWRCRMSLSMCGRSSTKGGPFPSVSSRCVPWMSR